MGKVRRATRFGMAMVVAIFSGSMALSASHLWIINEVYSNSDGTIQFVEMWCPAPNETSTAGKSVHTNANSSAGFPFNLPVGSTTNKHLLLATAAFAALPGAPTPDLTIPANFVNIGGDSIQWHIYPASVLGFGAGELPTDGILSLNEDGTTGPATPKNFAGNGFAPPGVDQLAVAKLAGFPDGSRLNVSWDDASCVGAAGFHLVYGFGSQLPVALGGTYLLQPAAASQCGIAGSPKIWSGVPNPASDATRYLYFLVLADDGGSTEGSWGVDGAGDERSGPMSGASGQCGAMTKDVANGCP